MLPWPIDLQACLDPLLPTSVFRESYSYERLCIGLLLVTELYLEILHIAGNLMILNAREKHCIGLHVAIT